MSTAPRTVITNRYQRPATEWRAAKDNLDAAQAVLDAKRNDLLDRFGHEDEAEPFIIINTPLGEVAVQRKDRREFNATKLGLLIPAERFKAVTKTVVVPTEFDKFVKGGKIDAKVVSKVVTSTEYVAVSKHGEA